MTTGTASGADKIRKILKTEVQGFIHANELADERKLVLKSNTICQVPSAWVAEQIAGRRKAKIKLPSWYKTENIIYPPSVNLEQCSSERTAAFKTEILRQNLSGFSNAVDLTGGLGVDTLSLGKIFSSVDYVEPDEYLFLLARHNLTLLKGAATISCFNDSAENFISKTDKHPDLIFLDPSRRTQTHRKAYRLQDCRPDATILVPSLWNITPCVLVKASPLIDLQDGCLSLPHVKKIFVVSVQNEVKEVLFLCQGSFSGEPIINACELSAHADDTPLIFSFTQREEKNAPVEFDLPQQYLLEPNAAILKSGAFKLVGSRLKLKKISPNTHLYTSAQVPDNFPGRVFAIEAFLKSDRKSIRHHFPEGKAHIITRNYPISTDQLRKKLGLAEGGEKFLIGFSGQNEKWLAAASRVV